MSADDDTRIALIVVAVILAVAAVASFGSGESDDDYPPEMNSCIYTGPGGWDC